MLDISTQSGTVACCRVLGAFLTHVLCCLSPSELNRSDTYGEEAEEADGEETKKQNLADMDFQELMSLRSQIDEALAGHRSTLEQQLASLGGSVGSSGRGARGGRGSNLKGTKVAAKYRGPEGETWAGRGATPGWMKEAVKSGKSREDFLIDKSGAEAATKRRTKK
jgi:DNA-binding protein H-NS